MKKKVIELTKELNIETDELLSKLKELGIDTKDETVEIDKKTIDLLSKDLKKNDDKAEDKVEEDKVEEGKVEEDKVEEEIKKEVVEIPEGSTVKEFAEIVGKDPSEIIQTLFKLGEMVTINQSLGDEAIDILADEVGLEAKVISAEEEEAEDLIVEVDDKNATPRPPVVTIMGHVDHGKTLLLDAIRKSNVISTEAGGITQHIGAYQVEHNNKQITFIDTPGHEAFTAMRARGAKVTDVAILVVAADDGVKPQTVEALDHAKAAKVPIVVAVNKIDKPEANPEKVRQELAKLEVTPEEWGGENVFVDVSAKTGKNLDDLLEMVLLVSDVQELKAVAQGPALGTVIESKIDKGRGVVATALIKQGVLNVGDSIIGGIAHGKVRALHDDQIRRIKNAGPSQPVEILGFNSPPKAGDILRVVSNEREARDIVEKRALKQRLREQRKKKHLTLEDLHDQIEEGKIKELKIVAKVDVQGSLEALKGSLAKIDQEEVRVSIIHSGVGAITENDVMLASASNAIIAGFNVRPVTSAKVLAEKEKVDLRTYRVIYKLVEDIEAARKGMLAPTIEEIIQGEATIKETFKAPKIGVIAGCSVSNGIIDRNSKIRLIRDGVVVQDTTVASLRRFKNDVNEVKEGYECGIVLENFQDVKVGDILEAYKEVEKPRE